MTELPLQDTGSALRDWAEDLLDHAAGFAQAALDMTALALVAGLLWMGQPEGPAPVQTAPGPMVTANCVIDCIETLPLATPLDEPMTSALTAPLAVSLTSGS
ncbi:hypothetical protein [Stagnihabitans tardus]|uniref:Uncharacterized protein n=1 Tax=Stagnihabitans tardus TaxID=2699202 RepID=A0AAE4YB38_9RHOB|nr:hypothetical protein [Stagnihabitans tardus]NBZ86680.1 hypothetical protein [Stagnihabitans tardus]